MNEQRRTVFVPPSLRYDILNWAHQSGQEQRALLSATQEGDIIVPKSFITSKDFVGAATGEHCEPSKKYFNAIWGMDTPIVIPLHSHPSYYSNAGQSKADAKVFEREHHMFGSTDWRSFLLKLVAFIATGAIPSGSRKEIIDGIASLRDVAFYEYLSNKKEGIRQLMTISQMEPQNSMGNVNTSC